MREAPPRPGRSFFTREEARAQERLRRPKWGPMSPRRCRGLHGASYFTYRNVCAVKKTRKNACGRPKSYARHNGPSFFTIEKRCLFFCPVFFPFRTPVFPCKKRGLVALASRAARFLRMFFLTPPFYQQNGGVGFTGARFFQCFFRVFVWGGGPNGCIYCRLRLLFVSSAAIARVSPLPPLPPHWACGKTTILA